MLTDKLKELNVRLMLDDMIGLDYMHDEFPGGNYAPDAVVEAASTDDVSTVLRACAEAGVPVTVRGAGTGQAGGSVPVQGGIVLSMKGMDKVLGFDPETKMLKVQPGVLLKDIKAEADSRGLYYPPDPGEQTATIGGNAATNAAGPCTVKYGRTRDYIADAVIVLADGSVVKLSDKSEYEVVLGSEGTLGVITELTLKLADKPSADAILLLPFMDIETAAKAASTITASDLAPATVELMDTDLVELSGNVTGEAVFPVEMDGERVGATLMVTLEGADDDEVMEQMEQLAEMAEEIECLDILVGDTISMKRDFRAAYSAFHSSIESGAKSAREVNIDLPSDRVMEMIAFAKSLGEEKGVEVMVCSHIASGGLHIHAISNLSREESATAFADFTRDVYAKCLELGGDIAGEYGVGYAKKAFLPTDKRATFKALKEKFDPQGILNPGKVAD